MTKFKPILFSTPMVQALLEGKKTMTRRVIKHDNGEDLMQDSRIKAEITNEGIMVHFKLETGKPKESFCGIKGKYRVGDILWVRETFHLSEFPQADGKYSYKASMDNPDAIWNKGIWKPSIFMPKEAARIFLKVTSIRVERLQNITENNAVNEGVNKQDPYSYECYLCKEIGHKGVKYLCEDGFFDNAFESFRTLWESINGIDSWSLNPFVWVIEFEKIEKPLDFIS